MRRLALAGACAALLLSMASARPAAAHDFEAHVVTLEAQAPGRYLVSSRWAKGRPPPNWALPDACRWTPPILACDAPDASLGFEGLPPGHAGLLVRVIDVEGAVSERFVTAAKPTFALGGPEPGGGALRYVALGIEHILVGVDHLLFLLMLVLLVRGVSRLVATVSAFTVGHSLTLVISVVWGSLPSAPVEAAIALSVVILARDVVRGRDRHFARNAVFVTALFGTVHGLGFAGVLTDIGLPPGERVIALLAFNVGVEIGQLAFVAAVCGARALVAPLRSSWAGRGAGYATGIVATTWLIARATALGAGG